MSIYNNIKLTAPPVRLDDGSLVPSLDSGSAEQVATMAPIMGSFRGVLRDIGGGGAYQSFKITPPRTTSTIAGPPSYPYNTLHIKGIALKEQTSYGGSGGTLTTGFEYWTAITNPYWSLISSNFLLTSPSSFDENTIIFPSIGANNLHPIPVDNPSFFNNLYHNHRIHQNRKSLFLHHMHHQSHLNVLLYFYHRLSYFYRLRQCIHIKTIRKRSIMQH